MRGLPSRRDPNLLSGWDNGEDAALWRIGEGRLAILTVDFITPIVDDPLTFGEIAAANSLSDVFAMGGSPKVALNLVAFPTSCEPLEVLSQILEGGARKVMEAGACLAGGHSVQDEEPKYGLSVYGEVDEGGLWRVTGAREGDSLILTKPVGSGIITTASKGGVAEGDWLDQAVQWMRMLNNVPGRMDRSLLGNVRAATDVTGFGLLGHCMDMLSHRELDLVIHHDQVPFIDGAFQMASMGMVPAGAYSNRGHVEHRVLMSPNVPLAVQDILFDPQTSGGLLLAVAPGSEKEVLSQLWELGFHRAATVGRFIKGEGKVLVE